MECTPDPFCQGFDEEQLVEAEKLDINWRDCCLCGVDIEGICRQAGKEIEWDDDPMILLIKGGRQAQINEAGTVTKRQYTDSSGWLWITLFDVASHRKAWACGVDWKDRRWGFVYNWHDGPIWEFCAGPFWVAIGCWY
jgi:hypothetical protein